MNGLPTVDVHSSVADDARAANTTELEAVLNVLTGASPCVGRLETPNVLSTSVGLRMAPDGDVQFRGRYT